VGAESQQARDLRDLEFQGIAVVMVIGEYIALCGLLRSFESMGSQFPTVLGRQSVGV
jgi:hypothetical protein